MRPNFKNIDIANDAFNVKHNPLPKGEVWKNAELIDIKPIYTHEDIQPRPRVSIVRWNLKEGGGKSLV